jgi:hypothetical protein
VEDLGERGSVWVMNTTSSSFLKKGAEVVLGIPNKNGPGGQALVIQQTWLPQDLCEIYPKDRILQSTDFRSSVREGLIAIISEADAIRLMDSKGVREERDRLRRLKEHVSNASAARTINQKQVEITRVDGVTDDDDDEPQSGHDGVEVYNDRQIQAKLANGEVDKDDNGMDSGFMIFYERLLEKSDIPALNDIKTRGRFSRKELRFMRDNLPRAEFPDTVSALKARIKQFKTK